MNLGRSQDLGDFAKSPVVGNCRLLIQLSFLLGQDKSCPGNQQSADSKASSLYSQLLVTVLEAPLTKFWEASSLIS